MTPSNDPRVRLGHMLQEIDGILEAVSGIPFDRVARTYTLIRSVERGLQIISEAAKALPEEVRTAAPQVP
jgi:uncharacterized protein with HEPN domain